MILKILNKKVMMLTLAFTLSATPIVSSVNAAKEVPSSSRPSVTYGSSSYYNHQEYLGPWPKEHWNTVGTANYYDGWDKDSFEAINYQANVSLSTTSTSTYKISGSTEFGISKVAKFGFSGDWGQTWGKTTTVTYDAQPGYIYELWSANQVKAEFWRYEYSKLFGGDVKLQATAHKSDGSKKWFFRYKR